MDKKMLDEKLATKSWYRHLEQVYDSRSRIDEFRELIQTRGRELAILYCNTADGFREIFEIVGSTAVKQGGIRSNPIILAHYQDEYLGSGTAVAKLTGREKEIPFAFVDTEVWFEPENLDGRSTQLLASESFSTVGWSLHGGTRFLNNNYDWIREKGNLGLGLGESRAVNEAWSEIGIIIKNAQETQTMLLDAISNPDLNPQYSERIPTSA